MSFDIKALTLHGRTTKEMSKVPNHWDKIGDVVKIRDKIAPELTIVGNGDVLTRAQGVELSEQWGVDGIMVGRGIFQNPYLFDEGTDWASVDKTNKIALYKKHIKLFLDFWDNKKNPASLKKFAKVYVNGFAGASEDRAGLMECSTAEELLDRLNVL